MEIMKPQQKRSSIDIDLSAAPNIRIEQTVEHKQYAERARRMSTLSRSDAIHGYQPVKQNSNPLPEHPRIYERGHEHSRSWNLENQQSMSPSPPQQNDYQYYQMASFVHIYIHMIWWLSHVVDNMFCP
ncbi:hypothetical protein RB195_017383 [Necator americanus]|uniref:Uncharacterized protein n=1 Tax=Necator americanus TaxID=51031 RepID=A0ABR1C4Z6_NECAM